MSTLGNALVGVLMLRAMLALNSRGSRMTLWDSLKSHVLSPIVHSVVLAWDFLMRGERNSL